jgi:hypothetical protein
MCPPKDSKSQELSKDSQGSPEAPLHSPISHHIAVPPSSPNSNISPKDTDDQRRISEVSDVDLPSPVLEPQVLKRELGPMMDAYHILVRNLERPSNVNHGSSNKCILGRATELETEEESIKATSILEHKSQTHLGKQGNGEEKWVYNEGRESAQKKEEL